ncbi:hypothetical protein BDV98DRAFT_583241 [Pterulicium gracile]|uniref:Uncharacterized protein n=1 Tax=Pterulicium gracile TaxID=1884261 RepID=A0A5C3QFD7_9AGAR|nr:hypothetical protein BDV98DRAFT_583241 [Pterula gracilis]
MSRGHSGVTTLNGGRSASVGAQTRATVIDDRDAQRVFDVRRPGRRDDDTELVNAGCVLLAKTLYDVARAPGISDSKVAGGVGKAELHEGEESLTCSPKICVTSAKHEETGANIRVQWAPRSIPTSRPRQKLVGQRGSRLICSLDEKRECLIEIGQGAITSAVTTDGAEDPVAASEKECGKWESQRGTEGVEKLWTAGVEAVHTRSGTEGGIEMEVFP